MRKTVLSLILFSLLLTVGSIAQEAEAPVTDAETVRQWYEDGKDFVIIDLRPENQLVNGRIPGSEQLQYFIFKPSSPPEVSPDFYQALSRIADKESTILAICSTGWTSSRAAADLKERGYTNVSYFQNGYYGSRENRAATEYQKGWMAHGLPFEKGSELPSDYSYDEGVDIVDAATVRQWIDDETPFTIIDVRTPREIDEYGRPENSHLVPLNVPGEDGEGWIVNPQFEAKIAELAGGKDKKILTICTLSMRAARAAHMLQDAGFTDVHVFRHGIQGRISGYEITKGWRAEGLPYEEAKDSQ